MMTSAPPRRCPARLTAQPQFRPSFPPRRNPAPHRRNYSQVAAQAPTSDHVIVAVLPLDNNSGDAAQDFFAEGMTDEIAVALSGVPGIDVVARSSSFQLKPSSR